MVDSESTDASLRVSLLLKNIVYDKACDLVENKVTLSYFSKTMINGSFVVALPGV